MSDSPVLELLPAALGLGVLAAACGGHDRAAFVSLGDQASLARVLAQEAPDLDGTSVMWVREGFAGLQVVLDPRDAEQRLEEGYRAFTWPLPLPLAETGGRGYAQPSLAGLDAVRIVPGMELSSDRTAGFWVAGRSLVVVLAGDEPLPEWFALTYPVYAAHLAGTALIAGFPPEDVYRVSLVRGDTASTCFAVPTGARLVVPLPDIEAGRLSGRLSMLVDPWGEPADEPAIARVALRYSRTRARTYDLVADGSWRPLAEDGGAWSGIDVPAATRGDALEVTVEGDPGRLVFLEAPRVGRERRRGDPPNVLLVVVDTLRADRLGAWGNEDGLTPNLDELCEDSLRFEQCWSGSSWTLPSIATMLTSNHGGQHRAWIDVNRLGRGVDTLPELFREHGYRTAAFTDGAFVGPHFGFDRGFDHYDATGGGVEPVVERARRFVRESDGPWLVLLHTYEVHAPYEPPPDVERRVLERYARGLQGETPEPHRFYSRTADGTPIAEDVSRLLEDLYDEEVRYTDRVLGGLLDELRADGTLDRTVVCLTADHGEEFGEHGLLGHGDTLYVEQLHVPLLVRFPDGKHAGRVDRRPVSLVDLAPTLVAAAGLDVDFADTTFVGRPLQGPGAPSPVYAVRQHQEMGLLEALRQDEMVWIRGSYFRPEPRPSDAGWQLYDLERDPRQLHPCGEDPTAQHHELARRLEALSAAFRESRVEDTSAASDARVHMVLRNLGYVGD